MNAPATSLLLICVGLRRSVSVPSVGVRVGRRPLGPLGHAVRVVDEHETDADRPDDEGQEPGGRLQAPHGRFRHQRGGELRHGNEEVDAPAEGVEKTLHVCAHTRLMGDERPDDGGGKGGSEVEERGPTPMHPTLRQQHDEVGDLLRRFVGDGGTDRGPECRAVALRREADDHAIDEVVEEVAEEHHSNHPRIDRTVPSAHPSAQAGALLLLTPCMHRILMGGLAPQEMAEVVGEDPYKPAQHDAHAPNRCGVRLCQPHAREMQPLRQQQEHRCRKDYP
mmetsp:Transcript_121989/g.352414  ORF Transcript_121989/g.352414 Transcript_121989/m.352414 type:complete len:279 (+) Transcript_121989:239-1075(+)